MAATMKSRSDRRTTYRVTFHDEGHAHYYFVSSKTKAREEARRMFPDRRVKDVQR